MIGKKIKNADTVHTTHYCSNLINMANTLWSIPLRPQATVQWSWQANEISFLWRLTALRTICVRSCARHSGWRKTPSYTHPIRTFKKVKIILQGDLSKYEKVNCKFFCNISKKGGRSYFIIDLQLWNEIYHNIFTKRALFWRVKCFHFNQTNWPNF